MSANVGLFPLGVATGVAHCNRQAEREGLVKSLLAGEHTWLWGRRRMGKTSLVAQALADIASQRTPVAAATLDLLVIHDAQDFEARMRAAVEQLVAQIAAKDKQASRKLGKALGAWRPEFILGGMGLKVKLAPAGQAVQGVADMLLALDGAAGAYGYRAVIVLDEFQQLGQLKPADVQLGVEGAVRHAVERARHVSYVFAGSRRHLLASMFEDAERPLFRLCRKLTLGRIEAADYRAFIRRASTRRWRRITADAVVDEILAATARHPYYVNALCGRLWQGDAPPTAAAVQATWRQIVDEDKAIAAGQLVQLPASHRALLKAIAQTPGGVAHPTSLAFLAPIRLPPSTGNRAKESLEEADFIRQEDDGRWTLVDPVMAAHLATL